MKLLQFMTFFNITPKMNIKFGAGAVFRYGLGSTKMTQLLSAPAPQHFFKSQFWQKEKFTFLNTVLKQGSLNPHILKNLVAFLFLNSKKPFTQETDKKPVKNCFFFLNLFLTILYPSVLYNSLDLPVCIGLIPEVIYCVIGPK
jgi:hypothetical protein